MTRFARSFVAALADRGELEVGRPVADYWPAFGSAGKHHVTVADVLQHRSGTPYPPGYRRIASQDDTESLGAEWRVGPDACRERARRSYR
jgi:CubicO group peptidase (beta-lactamase class C family)